MEREVLLFRPQCHFTTVDPLNEITVDGSEIRRLFIPLVPGFFTSQVVIAGFLNHQQHVGVWICCCSTIEIVKNLDA